MRKLAEFDTNMGKFKVELYGDKAPLTVGNFVRLVDKGFYKGLTFHRVIDGFVIQGGCPHGTGRGGPGYTIRDEFHSTLKHDSPGIMSMANSGPDTGGCQFFITVTPTPWLDGKHTIFGKVTEGMDTVMAISKVQTDQYERPRKQIIINSITLKDI